MRKVYIICTGGTLGMAPGESGLHMASGHIEDKIRALPLMSYPKMPDITFKELELIDSSQMSLDYWNIIASEIAEHYEEYDGFVILHGTDTMSYTGSALSFMLRNLAKPVILTGAQTPWDEAVSDAHTNIPNSIFIAGNYPGINEVCIYFNQKLLRANRTAKVSTRKYKAYHSYNYPPLGTVGSKIKINPDLLLPKKSDERLLLTNFEAVDIRTVRITPYLTVSGLASVLEGAAAVLLETYGDGNMQTTAAFLELLTAANERGVILINRSQCPDSMTDSDIYSEGSKLHSCGVISAGDQTVEAITAKLTYLFNSAEYKSTHDLVWVKARMHEDICGELTECHADTSTCSLDEASTDTATIARDSGLGSDSSMTSGALTSCELTPPPFNGAGHSVSYPQDGVSLFSRGRCGVPPLSPDASVEDTRTLRR